MIKQLFLLLKIKLQIFINQIKRLKANVLLKFLLLGGVSILFFSGLYIGFYRVLAYLETVPLLGKILSLKLFGLIFLTFFLMLIFSNLLTGLNTFFSAKDLSFLFVSPFSSLTVFLYKFLQTMFYSSWMVGITLLPFLLAYARVKGGDLFFYLIFFLLSLPYFFIASVLGVSLAVFFIHLFPSLRLRNIFFILTVFLGGGIYLLIRLLQPEELANPEKLTEVFQYLTFLETPSARYLPSWWLTASVNAYLAKNFTDLRTYTFFLYGSGLFLFSFLVILGKKIYLSSWLNLQSAGERHRSAFSEGKNQERKVTLLRKDIKIFFRDSHQWAQMFLLIPLILVYLFNLYKLPLDTIYLKNLIAFLNIGMAGFVLSAVVLRFVFPAVSLEGESFWVLRSAPISIKQIIRTKLLLVFLPLSIFSGIIYFFSNWLLKAYSFLWIISGITTFLFTFALSGLGLGLGATYRKFKVENIAQIETSAGGIFYILSALFYLGLCLAFLSVPVRMYFLSRMGRIGAFNYSVVAITLLAVFLLSLGIFFIPLFSGIKKLENLEM